jgi:hypothetical protein
VGDAYSYVPAAPNPNGPGQTPPQWTAGGNNVEDNVELAKAITEWRDGNPYAGIPAGGPFLSIFDLYRVPAFREAQRVAYLAAPHNPGMAQGDFTSQLGATQADDTRYDFEEQFLVMNKISNLITVRSDSFTVYILVQGWRGIGTSKPELVVQRRAAFIQDRSPVSEQNRTLPAAVNVPND